MTEARRLLERCAPYIDGRVTAFSRGTDREALNRVRSELLRDIDAYLAQPMTKSALLNQVLPVFSTARDSEGTCKTCGVLAPVMHDPKCVWAIAYAALTALDESREGELVAALEKVDAEVKDAGCDERFARADGKPCGECLACRIRAALAQGEKE